MAETRLNLGLVSTFGADFLSELIDVQSPLARTIHVIAPGVKREWHNVFFYPMKYEVGENVFEQALNQVIAQIKMSYKVARLARKVDFWIFFGGDVFLLPILTAKVFKTRIMLTLLGNLEKETTMKKSILNGIQIAFKRMNCVLSDKIIVYSTRLVNQWGLENYNGKILIAESQYVDFSKFKIEKPLASRGKLVGYIGRLSPEKGIVNFIKAVPLVLDKEPDTEFVIIGDGPLYKDVKEYLGGANLNSKVKITGRIPHSEVPEYLNDFRLYVLSSYSEGMPGTILEAMACGTPVLTTPVGAIMDLIEDGKTGFIMEHNSPECIAENIIEALNCRNLAKVADSARELVQSQFSLDAAQQKYMRIMEEAAVLARK